ncbi:MAG TPA: Stp1/IreP family PP2C-type Ser/Thr phosphatase [Thermodesulfobacteriota bacterium]|nr:Stp1/IreP family PP2C-type Ser/Thr phosphatase [Thermodesulfobacteriota bacterium]
MRLIVHGKTDKGLVRKENEDAFCIEKDLGLLAIADGMGGHASGEVASKMAIEILRNSLKKEGEPVPDRLNSGVKLANKMIYEASRSQSQLNGMGTTLTAVQFDGNRLSIAHVGDSRAYLIRGGVIEQLTDDHMIVFEQMARGMITREEAARSDMRNILSKALGIAPEVDVDMEELTVSEGDQLVLCSDGLSELISDDEILAEVQSSNRPDLVCNELVDLANQRGGEDNITVIVAHFHRENLPFRLLRILGWIRR